MNHLNTLQLLLSNERIRLANAKNKQERELRSVWVKQLEKEVAFEEKHFAECNAECNMTDDELLAALEA